MVTREEIIKHISNGETKKALNLAKDLEKIQKSPNINKLLTVIQGEYNLYKKRSLIGLEDKANTLNRINYALLEILDLDVEDERFNDQMQQVTSIEEIISLSKEQSKKDNATLLIKRKPKETSFFNPNNELIRNEIQIFVDGVIRSELLPGESYRASISNSIHYVQFKSHYHVTMRNNQGFSVTSRYNVESKVIARKFNSDEIVNISIDFKGGLFKVSKKTIEFEFSVD